MTIEQDGNKTKRTYSSDGNSLEVGNRGEDEIYVLEGDIDHGSVKGSKVNLAFKDNQIGDVDLSGIRFAVVNNSENSVYEHTTKTQIEKGKVVAILTTKSDGTFEAEEKSLPYGTYKIYELKRDYNPKIGDTYS